MRNGGSQDSGRKNATGGGSWLRQRRRTPLGESEIKPNLIRMNQTNFNFAPLCIHFTKLGPGGGARLDRQARIQFGAGTFWKKNHEKPTWNHEKP